MTYKVGKSFINATGNMVVMVMRKERDYYRVKVLSDSSFRSHVGDTLCASMVMVWDSPEEQRRMPSNDWVWKPLEEMKMGVPL